MGSPLQAENRLGQKRRNLLSDLWFLGFVYLFEERWWKITKGGAIILEKLSDAKR